MKPGVLLRGSREVKLALAVAAISALALACTVRLLAEIPPGPPPQAFYFLFLTEEPAAALLALVLAVCGLAAALGLRHDPSRRIAEALGNHALLCAAAATVTMAVGAWLVYRTHPLSMDEYLPVFQSRAFAALSLSGRAPPDLAQRLVFLGVSAEGRVFSTYWPGYALLLAPFVRAGVPWLLNPLLSGATIVLLASLARRILASAAAAGWTILLAAASPVFLVDGMSYYPLAAHLFLNCLFARLLLDPSPRRDFLAGLVGSLALVLNNPVPHALFALPWLAVLARRRPEGIRRLAILAAGYLPLTLVLGVGWATLRVRWSATAGASMGAITNQTVGSAFAWPTAGLLWDRLLNLLKLCLWAVPGLVPLAAMAAWSRRHDEKLRLFTLSAATTLAGYLFVPYNQGHGWGYRYFHPAWAALPLLGAATLVERPERSERLSRFVLACALGSLFLGAGQRFVQVRRFIDRHLAQLPSPAGSAREVLFVRIQQGYYTTDLIQDDPFFRQQRWILVSFGEDRDRELLLRHFQVARRLGGNGVATIWQVDMPLDPASRL